MQFMQDNKYALCNVQYTVYCAKCIQIKCARYIHYEVLITRAVESDFKKSNKSRIPKSF